MSDELELLFKELNKSKTEFDIATTCVAQALQSMCERMDRIELWISESQKNQAK